MFQCQLVGYTTRTFFLVFIGTRGKTKGQAHLGKVGIKDKNGTPASAFFGEARKGLYLARDW